MLMLKIKVFVIQLRLNSSRITTQSYSYEWVSISHIKHSLTMISFIMYANLNLAIKQSIIALTLNVQISNFYNHFSSRTQYQSDFPLITVIR